MVLKLKCSCSNLKVKITVKHMLMQYFSQWWFLARANRAAFFSWHVGGGTSTWKKQICAAKRFSIIYHITLWGIGKLAPLLAEKVPCTEAVWEVERGGGRGHGGQFTSPKWSGQGGGRDPLSGLKSVTPWLFPNNAHFVHNIKTQAYNLHVFVFSKLCEMANKNR